MYEASGQWSTTYSQPSLTDGRGEKGGRRGVRAGGAGAAY